LLKAASRTASFESFKVRMLNASSTMVVGLVKAAKRRGDGAGNGTGGSVETAVTRRGDDGGNGTDAIRAGRVPMGSGLRARFMRCGERAGIAALSPLVLTIVMETSSRQEPG
jgi:hypothetical protein